MSLGISVNKDKNGMLLAYIAHNIPDIHLRKLLKIIYLIDEHFMKMRGFPMTWFEYYAWAKGPVAPEVYEIKNGAFGDFVQAHRSLDNKWRVNAIRQYNEVIQSMNQGFSISELSEINKLIAIYKNCSADELSDITHRQDSLWSKTVAQNKIVFDNDRVKPEVQIDLRMLFCDSDSRKEKFEEALWNMKLQEQLSSRCNPNDRIHLQVVSAGERERYSIPAYTPAIP